MAQLPESLNMDRRGLTFSKKHQLTISKNLAILVLVAFLTTIVITGLVTHYATLYADEERCAASHEATTKPTHEEDTNNTGDNGHTTEPTTTTSSSTTPPIVTDQPEESNVTGRYLRLPTSVVPVEYDLRMLTIMENFTFSGSVRIHVNITMPTDNVTLHVAKLNITCEDVQVIMVDVSETGQSIEVNECVEDEDLQFYILKFDSNLQVGFYNISLKFNGELKDELAGYYRSSYKNGDTTRWLAATQFEATDARSAFPCFDEPAFKAVFKISIGRPNNMSAISNMPRIDSQPDPEFKDYTWDEFAPSVPMSTYLIAFIVSDFKNRTIGNFSLYARESALNQTTIAVEHGPKFLKYLETFFNVPFPLPKMDLAAIPDFSAGAMENWGLITFRESNLLYQEGVSAKRNLQRIAIVIAHELGHQWFGNLVTPTWWTDLWLNEGFASYLEYLATNAIHPEWKMMDQFVIDDLQSVLSLDALKSSHPISVVVNNPNEITDIFDRISYQKGATIIRMMEDFLTTHSFRKGLTNYLIDRQYKNAQQDDLWAALTSQAQKDSVFAEGITVKQVMDTWTLQMGFPVITINRTENGIIASQQRFTLNSSDAVGNYSWWVPLTYKSKTKAMVRQWLSKDDQSAMLEYSKLSDTEWLLVNLNQTGYYRVNYDALGWSLLDAQLHDDHTTIDPKNRAQIMNDALSLASSGYLDYDIALNLTTYLKKETEYVPWRAALGCLDFLCEMFQRSGHFDKFKSYLTSLIRPIYKRIGFDDGAKDALLTTYLREDVLYRACRLGLTECVQWAHTEFNNWMMAPNPDEINEISPNLKLTVYCTAIEFGGEKAWRFAWERFLRANVGTERELLLTALGCTKETWLLNKYMTMALTPGSGIKKQDVQLVFRAVGKNIIGQTIGMRFVLTKWDEINKYVGKSITTTSGIITAVMKNLNTEKELEELKIFSKKYESDETFSQRNANQIMELTQANINWMNSYFQPIVDWLTNYEQQTAPPMHH